ncbi:MAG: HAD family phosphatase [Deltaproteobacteria bacterium]|nr:HAD family phosphatase [Deltaproteobacteria bacterium]
MKISPENVQAVIFDLDGVILDSMPAHVASWRKALGEFDLEVDADFILRHEGALDRDLLVHLFERNGQRVAPELFDRIYLRQREIYWDQYAAEVPVFPGAARLVELLARTALRLALVTSSSREVLTPDLWTWLASSFSPLITGDQVRRSKPHPEPYLKALAGLGLPAAEVLVVENAPAGIASARAAGLTCLALATTLPPAELAEADLVLDNHAALRIFLVRDGVIDAEALGAFSAWDVNKEQA